MRLLQKINGFNGWQRLWVLISTILLIPFIFIFLHVVTLPPKINETKACKANQLVGVVEDCLQKGSERDRLILQIYKEDIRRNMLDQAISWIEKKYSNDPRFSDEIDNIRAEYIRALYIQKSKPILYGVFVLVVWVAVIILLYFVGWQVAWVCSGFKK